MKLIVDFYIRAIYIPMRLIISFFMFSIILSGFMTAAHAFEPVSDGKAGITLCDDCQGKNADSTQDQDDAPAKSCDLSCHNCCAGHVGFLSSASVNLVSASATLSPLYEQKLADAFLFSLLRPPRILV
jgi:hypothetical protein